MTGQDFQSFMRLFIKHTRVTKERPVQLFLDNHQSHLDLPTLVLAKETRVGYDHHRSSALRATPLLLYPLGSGTPSRWTLIDEKPPVYPLGSGTPSRRTLIGEKPQDITYPAASHPLTRGTHEWG
ncbi:hypothetical protein AVEN_66423-1 [Araneus ventricosus]|uniref:DDE-1 domain-containing protein n=1 Tax=Araneus ventricosus TaxID=182803 RepID=A0A4Y2EL26_ARAVE|nr:hypothetical protein AVEN_66423-1 [Araneus ventricosus]